MFQKHHTISRFVTPASWWIIPVIIVFALCLTLISGVITKVSHVHANSPGSIVYTPSSNEGISYSRVLRLQYSGSANGILLTTFENWSSHSSYHIMRSTDNGAQWKQIATLGDPETGSNHPWPNMFQPAFFEFPHAINGYPAGTILMAGNVTAPDQSATHFDLWRSTNQGQDWKFVSTFQAGGGLGNGIWEPAFQLDKNGNLLCYFSDERESGTHSQFLGHVASTDGGDSWGAEVKDVASANRGDRPGMVTVVSLPNGSYIMSFELCGYVNCEVHIKTSPDGDSWGSGPSDLGKRVQTSDGRYFGHSPYLIWTPAGGPNGQLILDAQREYYANGDGTTTEDYRALMVNTDLGSGNWSWMPAPFKPDSSSSNCNTNYSPALTSLGDGSSVLLVASSSMGSSGSCEVRADSMNAGTLPYNDAFRNGTDAGWNTYNGTWSVVNGVYSEQSSASNGDKSVTGSTGWTDYTLSGDINLTASTNAGFLVRVSNPGNGADALQGYFVGLDSGSGNLFMGKQNYNWTMLNSVLMPGGVAQNTWYHITTKVAGCTFTVTAQPAGGNITSFTHTDPNCFSSGQVGMRTWSANSAEWKNISVTSN